ncbi:MAG TPA: DUF411 domain-containing protein [Gemmatimonadales bacterium]|nr:DUF411 domain-containing protein [Gemmatimonadales bacterium]
MISRRRFMTQIAAAIAAGSVVRQVTGQLPLPSLRPTPITVYKSKSCGCCANWVDYLRNAGFEPTVHDEEDMDAVKDSLGVPEHLRSCHTAVIDRYLVEGHVPAPDIRRLISTKSQLQGLAVPGMPSGTPGMAPAGAPLAGFEVVGFTRQGTSSVFARY